MKPAVPVTYYINWKIVHDDLGPVIMEILVSYGIENIVLTDALMPGLSDLDFHELLLKSAKAAGLTFVDAHATIQETELLGLAPEKNRRAMLRHSENQLYLASEFGCKTCTVHCWNWRPDSHNAEERFTYICDSLEKLLPAAEKAGVIMAIENVWSPPTTADMLVRIVEHFNSPYLGLCYDAGHAFIFDHGRKDPERSCVNDTDTMWCVETAINLDELADGKVKLAPDIPWEILLARYNFSKYAPQRELSTCPQMSKTDFHLQEEYGRLRLIRQ